MPTQYIAALIIAIPSVMLIASLAYWLGGLRTRRSAHEITNLNEIGRQLLRSQLSVDGLCELLYWHAGQIVPANLFQLGLFDDTTYIVKVWVRDSERIPGAVFPSGGSKGIVGWVRETGKPLLVHDFESERETLPAFPEQEQDSPPRSGLFVPLIAGNATIGVIAIQSRQPNRFTEEHVRLLTALANQAAWAVRNAQLFEHANLRAEQLSLIGQIGAQISSSQPLDDLFRQTVTLIQQTFGYYCVSIFTLEEETLSIAATTSQAFRELDPCIQVGQGMIGWAAEHCTYGLANNVEGDLRYRKLSVLPETMSEIALPFQVEERILGILDVQSNEKDAFQSDDVFVLETLAAQVALAIEQAQSYADQEGLAQRLEILAQVVQAVVSILDLNDLLDEVVDLVSENFGFERVHIFLRSGSTLVFRAGAGPHSVQWQVDNLTYDLDDVGLIPMVGRTGQAISVGDVRNSPDYRAGPGLEDTISELALPIKMGSNILGVIDLQSDLKDAFADGDISLMQALADSVAVAIRNAVLYVNERKRRNVANILRDISSDLISNLDLDRMLVQILNALGHVVAIESSAILLIDTNGDTLSVVAATGQAQQTGIVGREFPISQFPAADRSDLQEAVANVYHELLDFEEQHSCITVTLSAGGHLLGFLIVDNGDSDSYTTEDQTIVTAFANQASVALHNARLFTAQQSDAWVTTALLQVAEAVNAEADVTEALSTTAHLTTLLAGVNHCLILRWEPQDNAYYIVAHYGVHLPDNIEWSRAAIPAEDYPYLELLTVADQPLGAGQGHELPIPQPIVHWTGEPSIIGFPLRAKQEPVGLLVVDDPRKGGALDPRLLNILTGIAHQMATALEASILQRSVVERERLERELDVAREIQASFIPKSPPTEEGWSMEAYWRAARQVSGDFYDFIPLEGGRWGMVIADVTDKGIPAALFMAICRTLLRAAAIHRSSPAEVLMRLNTLLFNDTSSDLFVTAFYAIWDPSSGEFTYACGGHNPPLFVRARNGSIEELGTDGIALGVIPEAKIQERSLTLQPGDLILAYTDGLTEAMEGTMAQWGIARLKSTLGDLHHETPKHIRAGILSALDEFVGTAPQSDDLTFWLLKRAS